MMPIVNGLEAEFEQQIAFVSLDAIDGAEGQRAFEKSGLPGHPSYLIFATSGEEIYRSFGSVGVETLRMAILKTLADLATTENP